MSDGQIAAIERALHKGAGFLVSRQRQDGSWQGPYGGPMFLLPMYVAAAHICRQTIPGDLRAGMIRHLRRAQLPDGAVGLHGDSRAGSMFTTVLAYVALRILGELPESSAMTRMRRWILDHGTAVATPSWGKFLLALLNLYDGAGLRPILPELYLLPRVSPLHPAILWCHARQVYLPMSYLYGVKARIPEDDFTRALRRELYGWPYDQIAFDRHRDTVYAGDLFSPLAPAAKLSHLGTRLYEKWHGRSLRARALRTVLEHIEHEDRTTAYLRLGPVNAVLNTLVHFFRAPGGEAFRRSWQGLAEYLCADGDEIVMNGQSSTALWDTAFAGLAILEASRAGEWAAALAAAHGYVRESQMIEEIPEGARYFRHPARGGWPFPNRAHGWPVSDCTAEALKLALALEARVAEPVPEERLLDAVRFILSLQNRDGGWGTYERQRGGRWLESLNPSEVFGEIMVDASRVENTSSCIQALAAARARFPGRSDREIERAVRRGERFLRRRQRAEGSWEGFWGVCLTYGTWFGVWGLRAAGAEAGDPAIRRAARFLLAHQRPDGGWGEDCRSCLKGTYHQHEESHPVQTAWSLMALVRAGLESSDGARAAARFLVSSQEESGDWPRGHIVGVFNRTSMIHYDNYRRYFCLWALALYRNALQAAA